MMNKDELLKMTEKAIMAAHEDPIHDEVIFYQAVAECTETLLERLTYLLHQHPETIAQITPPRASVMAALVDVYEFLFEVWHASTEALQTERTVEDFIRDLYEGRS
jgi:hypothetical protein